MNANGRKFRKRPYQPPADKKALSSILRKIGEHIQRRDFAAALSKADQALSNSRLSAADQGRVLALVGDGEFKRGRFAEAAKIQLQAASKSIGDSNLWLRPYVGYVQALLKVPQVEEALVMARHAVEMAESKMADFDEQVRLADESMDAMGAVEVPLVPPRVSVVATRMGYLFLQEGEPEAAEEFFIRAIETNPGGACRALQGLAKVALAQGDYPRALELATRAIRWGKFRAKTLPAWPILVAARHQMGGKRISDRLIEDLDAAPAGVRSRAILSIVRELRKNDMRQWREVAERWSSREGGRFPIIETEIRKMILSSAKAEPGNAADKREKAEQLLEMPGLSSKEWLTGAKELVRAGLWEGSPVDIEQLVATAAGVFGPDFAPRARHSLALSCMMAKRHDLARPVLQANVRQVAPNNPQWGKSVWALARMESFLDDHAVAAALYRRFADETSIDVRFRLQAQLLWCKELIAAGEPGPILEARSLMAATLGGVQDPDILMNFARQLQFGPAELQEWGQQLFARGKALALQRFNDEPEPAAAMSALFKLTRRQVRDFGRYEEAVAFWEGLPQEKRDWLWSENCNFWEYLGQVFEAYARKGKIKEAEAFANDFLDDPASPAEGLPLLGVPLARRLMLAGRATEGLELFERMARMAPTHPRCAEAWYWLALAAYKQGETGEVEKCAARIRAAQGSQVGMLDEWNLDARACLLLAHLDPAAVDPQAVNYAPGFLKGQLQSITGDLGRIRR